MFSSDTKGLLHAGLVELGSPLSSHLMWLHLARPVKNVKSATKLVAAGMPFKIPNLGHSAKACKKCQVSIHMGAAGMPFHLIRPVKNVKSATQVVAAGMPFKNCLHM